MPFGRQSYDAIEVLVAKPVSGIKLVPCVRFDVWVDSGEGAGFCKSLCRCTKGEWNVKSSIRWVDRSVRQLDSQKASGRRQGEPKSDGPRTLRTVPLNIHGI
jgi:hypothetical protein